MIRRLARASIGRFERRYGYDAAYLHAILDESIPAFLRLLAARWLGGRTDGVTAEACFAARFVAVRSEDCGPCAQLALDMARESGIALAVRSAVVARDLAALAPDVALALRFAEAIVARELSEELEAVVQARFGKRGRITLGYTIVAARTYPVLKRSLGHASSCARLRVDDSVAVEGVSSA